MEILELWYVGMKDTSQRSYILKKLPHQCFYADAKTVGNTILKWYQMLNYEEDPSLLIGRGQEKVVKVD